MPWSRVPLGYRKRDDATLEPNPDEVAVVERCFRMRLDGASYMTIRVMLREQGVERSPRGVEQLLQNRAYLGEIRFGSIVNLHAHEPIIDRDLFQRVQAMKVPRGRQPKSDRLLARLRVLRCGSCGSPLGTMKLPRQQDYPIYRCGSHNDCDSHVTIAAVPTEDWVWEQVKSKLADAEGRASNAREAERLSEQRDRAQQKLDRALRSYADAGLLDEPAAVETLAELRADRDAKQEAVDQLPPNAGIEVARVDNDMPLAVRRDLIRAVVKSVSVAPSGPRLPRGDGRLTIEFYG
jgi:site-specific DNA recombinase